MDRLESLEHVAFVMRLKAVKRHRVLADDEVRGEGGGVLRTHSRERGGGCHDAVSDAADIEHERRRADAQHCARQLCDHWWPFERVYEQPR